MDPTHPDVEDIVHSIRGAFHGVRRGRISMREAEVIDNYGSDEERTLARESDPDTPWEEIPDDLISESPWGMPHLDPKSWRYYIPAYMIWSLRHEDDACHIIHGFMIYTFTILSPECRSYDLERFRTLSPPQVVAVRRFLRHRTCGVFDVDQAQRALAEYWDRPEVVSDVP
jgi:hypothetical protein